MSFAAIHAQYPWDAVMASIAAKTETDVEIALQKSRRGQPLTLEDFKALLSPAAGRFLEPLAQLSHERTVQRFGRTMQLFAPV